MMYESKHREISLSRRVGSMYAEFLKDNLVGVIMCGGAGKADTTDHLGSDIDVIVVLLGLDPSIILRVSRAQAALGQLLQTKISHTVITLNELQNISALRCSVDGKAVQAIIEARPEDLFRLSLADIPELSDLDIVTYSKANFAVLQALLRKHLVRSDARMDNPTKVTGAKIALIVQKMYMQARGGRRYHQIWPGRDVLQDLKLHPQAYSSAQVRKLLLHYVSLRFEHEGNAISQTIAKRRKEKIRQSKSDVSIPDTHV